MKVLLYLSLLGLLHTALSMGNNKPATEPDPHDSKPAKRLVLNPITGDLFYTGLGSKKVCDLNCEDKVKYCHYPGFANMCKSRVGLIFALKCPKTCGLCTPCDSNAGTCSENCTDAQPSKCSIFAPTFCKHPSYGALVGKYCEKSCGICISCDGLTPVPDCNDDCIDNDRMCPFWANEKHYCKEESRFRQWMLINCQQSCGVCRNCDGEAPPGATRPPVIPTTSRPTKDYPPTSNPDPDNMCSKPKRKATTIKDQCLDAHNYFRCLHGVEDLKYSYNLEASARKYAGTFPTEASIIGLDRDDDVGENFAVLDSVKDGIEEAVGMWYAEGLGFDYQMRDLIQEETSQFTQLIWSDTTKVGCGVRRYNSRTYIVAHYFEGGNDEDVAFSNIFEPILDVCLATCGPRNNQQFCQSNDNSQRCECTSNGRYRDDDDEVPECLGACIVHCPEPRGNRYPWREVCEGHRRCTCNTEYSRGATLGAQCS